MKPVTYLIESKRLLFIVEFYRDTKLKANKSRGHKRTHCLFFCLAPVLLCVGLVLFFQQEKAFRFYAVSPIPLFFDRDFSTTLFGLGCRLKQGFYFVAHYLSIIGSPAIISNIEILFLIQKSMFLRGFSLALIEEGNHIISVFFLCSRKYNYKSICLLLADLAPSNVKTTGRQTVDGVSLQHSLFSLCWSTFPLFAFFLYFVYLIFSSFIILIWFCVICSCD